MTEAVRGCTRPGGACGRTGCRCRPASQMRIAKVGPQQRGSDGRARGARRRAYASHHCAQVSGTRHGALGVPGLTRECGLGVRPIACEVQPARHAPGPSAPRDASFANPLRAHRSSFRNRSAGAHEHGRRDHDCADSHPSVCSLAYAASALPSLGLIHWCSRRPPGSRPVRRPMCLSAPSQRCRHSLHAGRRPRRQRAAQAVRARGHAGVLDDRGRRG